MEKILDLRTCVDSLSKDAYKFFQKNNKAAGVRARKKLQKCKKLSQEIRIKIQKTKQENVQEKSAEISAIAALNGGNNLTREIMFQEDNYLPIHGGYNTPSVDIVDFAPPPPFRLNYEENFNNLHWDQVNFLENQVLEAPSSVESPVFYPSFED